MKNIQKLLVLIALVPVSNLISAPTEMDKRIKKIKSHQPEKAEKLNNPKSATVKQMPSYKSAGKSEYSYKEVNQPALDRHQKKHKLEAEKQMNTSVERFATGHADTVLKNENLVDFKNLDDEEQVKLVKRYITKRNRSQQDDLVQANADYQEKLKHFHKKTESDAMVLIKKLENNIRENDSELKKVHHKLNGKNLSDADKKQWEMELRHLRAKNSVNRDRIDRHLTILEHKLGQLDNDHKLRHHMITATYNAKDDDVLSTMQPIMRSKHKSLELVMPEVKKAKVKKVVASAPAQEVYEKFEAPMSVADAADAMSDVVLDSSIDSVKNALHAAKKEHKPNQSKIKYFRDQSDWLQKVQMYKKMH